MEEWFAKRDQIAEAWGVSPIEVPAEVVWFIVWPPPPLTPEIIAEGQAIAKELGLDKPQA